MFLKLTNFLIKLQNQRPKISHKHSNNVNLLICTHLVNIKQSFRLQTTKNKKAKINSQNFLFLFFKKRNNVNKV